MSWAAQRRFFILLIVSAITIAFITIVLITIFYKTPSCTDGVQNQDEQGIDCGGSCPYLCSAQEQPPTVLYTNALTNKAGRTDIIALVQNNNHIAAAKNVLYTIKIYDKNQLLLGQTTGTVDLPPGTNVPVYVPNVVSGNQTVRGAFLTIDPVSIQWYQMTSDPRILPKISPPIPGGTVDTPRVDATLTNSSVTSLTNVLAIVLVHDAHGEVIAASQTIVPIIPAQGQTTATFTWNDAFSSAPTLIEVVPIIPLP